jgi:aryl-alcohol dehydrogenase-like predicted oxidoreductase
MEYRALGNSDLLVSAVGFGCWEMAGEVYGRIDQDEVIRAVHRALDLGVTLFDTSPGYGSGRSEETLGRALRGHRTEAVITTKCGQYWSSERGWYRDSRRATIVRSIEDSLRRLRTDYVDLLLIHWPDTTHSFAETMDALNHLVHAGKARYVGVSNFRSDQLRACAALAPLVVTQVGYNLFDRRWEREMFPTARSLGIGIMAYGPLAHGLLTGTFSAETVFEPSDWRALGDVFGQPLFTPDNFAQNLRVVEQLKGLARTIGTTLPRLALAWVLRHPQVGSALCGTRRPEELEENVAALDVHLSEAILQEIEGVMSGAAGQTDQVPA